MIEKNNRILNERGFHEIRAVIGDSEEMRMSKDYFDCSKFAKVIRHASKVVCLGDTSIEVIEGADIKRLSKYLAEAEADINTFEACMKFIAE